MRWKIAIIFLLVIAGPAAGAAFAQEVPDAGTTLSPYFLVKSEDTSTDVLPLKSTSADVDIAGVIADVRVTQVYRNEGEKTLEAIYVFPASTRAAVYGMTMTIGDRTIKARIREREQARLDYEQAKQEGKSASLLEQQRPNVFQMNVANILPGDEIKVELSYTELLVPTDGTYEFVYPTVVGPRYSNLPAASAPSSEHWVANPYLKEGEAPPYTFDINVNLSAGLPIQKISCPTHSTSVDYDGKWFASVNLDESETFGGNRDFILNYQLAGGEIESGLLLYKGEEENFFLLMVQPPRRIESRFIPPREFIFIVDVSGSMRGFPLDISKKLLRDLISNLQPTDRLNVLLFAGRSAVLSQEESLPATAENLEKAIAFIDRQQGAGGTEILPAMSRALGLPRPEGMARTIVTVTDGYVRVEPEVFDLIRTSLGDANMFAFGIGSSVNRFIIEGMAHVGMGEPFVVTNREEAPAEAEKFRKYIQSPVLSHVELEFEGFDTYDVEPPAIPDVLAERPVVVVGKWKGEAAGKVHLAGFSGQSRYVKSYSAGGYQPMETNSGLRYLWARHRVMILDDFNNLRQDEEHKQEIVNLGLKYNLLTRFTSFVAIDTLVRAEGGDSETVTQPLPLPQGVPDSAVGGVKMMASQAYAPLTEAQSSMLARRIDGAQVPGPAPEPMSDKSGDFALPQPVFAMGEIQSSDPAVPLGKLAALVKPHMKSLNICQGLGQVPSDLKLEIRIAKDGKVEKVRVLSATANEYLRKCLVEQVGKWQLEGLRNKGTVTVIVPLIVRT